jgi:transcriptional regulator with XRE-family HTH domain
MIVDDLLDSAKKQLAMDTDYKLAKKLEISTGTITQYRQGKVMPNVYVYARLAEILNVDPFKLMIEIESETEKNPVRRAYWEGKRKTGQSAKTDPLYAWRARRDSNARPLPSEGSTLSS